MIIINDENDDDVDDDTKWDVYAKWAPMRCYKATNKPNNLVLSTSSSVKAMSHQKSKQGADGWNQRQNMQQVC